LANAVFEVTTYEYYQWSSRNRVKANVNLKGTGGERCFVWFEQDETALLPPAREIAPDTYEFWYHHSQLASLIDMLRNEKPIFCFFNDEGGFNNSRISTTDEPVGEGEEA
jgi:hypothetical protein